MTPTETPSELVTTESNLPEPSAKNAKQSIETYLEIQKVFDTAMPDAIIEIKGKRFRKKSYWRAIATAFHLDVIFISEERIESEGEWGYLATYRASANDRRYCDGDGACMVSEKPGAMGTIHNVRAHAHTRAKNRAIADLVGFGEVSADELGPDAFRDEAPRKPRPQQAPPQDGAKLASEKQIKMLTAKSYVRAAALGGKDDDHELAASIRKAAMQTLGFVTKDEITAAAVNPMADAIERAEVGDDGHAEIPSAEAFD